MNSDDKKIHFDNIIKNMTRVCHLHCFNKNSKLDIDQNCLSSCYHKYINSMKKIRNITIKLGDRKNSEFILKIFNTRKDYVLDYLWPPGGKTFMGHPLFGFRWIDDKKLYSYKGYSPYRDQMENQ